MIDVFVEALDLAEMSFEGLEPAAIGRPSCHPSVLLKFYIYDYLNRMQSSWRLEREGGHTGVMAECACSSLRSGLGRCPRGEYGHCPWRGSLSRFIEARTKRVPACQKRARISALSCIVLHLDPSTILKRFAETLILLDKMVLPDRIKLSTSPLPMRC